MPLQNNETVLIDTHAHIYHKRFAQDMTEMMARAREAGIEKIIAPATEPAEFPLLAELKQNFPEVEVAIGVHPHSAADVDDPALEQVPHVATECKAIAIGEIGLDYYYDFAPKDRQHQVFRRQLRYAKELGLPAVIHNRESDEDVLNILEQEQDGSLQFQLHCFSSSTEVLRKALDIGAMISFTGNITFKKSTLDEVVRLVPDDRVMIETDAPFMTPVPWRGKRNEPSYVGLVAEKIAEIRETTPEKVFQMTTQNARRFFALPLLLMFLLLTSVLSLEAQRRDTPEPVAEVDTVEREPYDKLIGFGPHLAATTFIVERATQANSASLGGWVTVSPLQPFGMHWLQLDFLYTPATTTPSADSITQVILDQNLTNPDTSFTNNHNTFNAWLRFVPNSKAFINFHFSIGYTYFFNAYGIDDYIINNNLAPDIDGFTHGYEESTWGIGGGLGLSMNIRTPYGLVVPTADLTFSSIVGSRSLPRHNGGFGISQARIAVLFYPQLGKALGMDK